MLFEDERINCPKEHFVEGVDFYYTEDGLFVFTEKYHLEKGYCCDMNCRHCPYKNKPASEPIIPSNGKKEKDN